MIYVSSKYTIEFYEVINGKKEAFLFNTLTTALAKINDEILDIYHQDLIDSQKCGSDIQELIENGFIVEQGTNEYETILINSKITRYAGNVLGLTIAPTMNCNMRCDYCFEQKEKIYMSREIMDGLISFVEKKVQDELITEINVTWYGGEPLLATDVILYLSEKLLAICDKNKISYEASIVSNGLKLNRDVATKLVEECKVTEAQITLDGTEEIHNSRRVTIDKSNGFKNIISNIVEIVDLLKVKIRVNVDKRNKDNIYELIDILYAELGLNKKIAINFARVIGEMESCYSVEEFCEIEFQFLKYLCEKNYIDFEKHEFQNMSVGCASIGTNYYVIDPLGYLYTCWNNVGIKALNIGHVLQGEQYNNNYNQWLLLEYDEKCKACIYLPICQGGCPYSRIHKNETRCNIMALNTIKYLKIKCKKMLE